MHRISTTLSAIALMAALGCLSLPRDGDVSSVRVAGNKPDFTSSGIDPTPVGTAKQIARIKRSRAERKA